ncbi:MAG: DsbE family thiol:disulfide interchange protein [Vicinamibacteria bacterium]|nr:DsbE family thiol:disulfide interchange protein [Vicinamibacteria bacterium]
MNRRILIVGGMVVLPLLALFFIGLGHDPREIYSPLIGRPAPSFTLTSLDGEEEISIDTTSGKPAILNFWASWCAPCLEEHSTLIEAARTLGDRVRLIGIVYDDTPENARAFLREAGEAFPTFFDPGGRVAIAYGVYGVPETFFIGADGRVVTKHTGPLSRKALAEHLRRMEEAP